MEWLAGFCLAFQTVVPVMQTCLAVRCVSPACRYRVADSYISCIAGYLGSMYSQKWKGGLKDIRSELSDNNRQVSPTTRNTDTAEPGAGLFSVVKEEKVQTMVANPYTRKPLDIFAGLDDNTLQQLETISQPKNFQSGDYIFHAGREKDCVYRIEDGCVIAERYCCKGERHILTYLFAGNFLGFFDELNYDLSMKCVNDACLTAYPKKEFSELVEQSRVLRDNLEEVSRRITAMALDYLYILANRCADEKICFFLRQLLMRAPDSHIDRIEIPASRQDLADHLGMTAETVCRSITRLRVEKIIRLNKRNVIQITDFERFQKMAG